MKKSITVLFLVTLSALSTLFVGCSSAPKAVEEAPVAAPPAAAEAPASLGASSAGRSQ
jgi:hypothetical protein